MKIVIQGVITIAFLLVIIGFLLDKKVEVLTEKEFDYPTEFVFPQINNLKNWANWNFWHLKDDKITLSYGDRYEGKDATYNWGSAKKSVGSGSLTITESIPNKLIEYTTNFGGKKVGAAKILFSPNSAGNCKIKWSFYSKTEGLLGGWVALILQKRIKRLIKNNIINLNYYLEENTVEQEKPGHLQFEKDS